MRFRAVFVAAATLATSSPAVASGGLSCVAEGKGIELTAESGVTRGMGGPLFNFRGAVTLSDAAIAADLKKTAFGDQHVAQYWLDGEVLNLLLYREREGDKPHGYVEVLIKTENKGDEGMLAGRYEIEVFDTTDDVSAEGKTVKFDGAIECMVE